MAVLYKTAAKEACAEQCIEKSRFIAHIRPVACRYEAESFITEIRSRYKDARHNVPAYVIGDKMQLQWGSDDGEPQGTAGAPIVQFLVNGGITNVCVVVTRYFGGIKLGTGGLVRAYTSSARLALELAGVFEQRDHQELEVELPYNMLAKLQSLQGSYPFTIVDINYADVLKIRLSFESEYRAEIESLLCDMTRGAFLKNSSENC